MWRSSKAWCSACLVRSSRWYLSSESTGVVDGRLAWTKIFPGGTWVCLGEERIDGRNAGRKSKKIEPTLVENRRTHDSGRLSVWMAVVLALRSQESVEVVEKARLEKDPRMRGV